MLWKSTNFLDMIEPFVKANFILLTYSIVNK